MTSNLPPAAERMAAMLDELDRLDNTFGSDVSQWPAGQRERRDRLTAGIKRANIEAEAEQASRQKHSTNEILEGIRSGKYGTENGFGAPHDLPDATRQADPWRGLDGNILRTETGTGLVTRAHDVVSYTPGLSDVARGMLADAIDSDQGPTFAAFVVARSAPAYESGFRKVLANPERAMFTMTPQELAAFSAVESIRASLTTNVGTGGYAIPLALDPNLSAIVNTGVANPFRAVSDVQTTISSPARALASTGITAEWAAEGAVMADASPAFTKVDIPLYKLDAFVSATFEVLGDAGASIGSALPVLLADARDRAEGSAYATGNGTTQPKGLVTALAAANAFTTATTRGSFTSASFVDIFAAWAAVPPRARQSRRVAWFGNVTAWNVVRQMGSTAPAGLFTVDFTQGQVPRLLGAGAYEASAMSSSFASGSYVMVAQDMAKFAIRDHIAGPALEYVPILFDQATGRPNGTRGWVFWERTGSDLLDTTQGTLLKA